MYTYCEMIATAFNTFKEGILVLGWIGTQLTDPILYFHAHRPYQQYGYAVTLQQILEMCPNFDITVLPYNNRHVLHQEDVPKATRAEALCSDRNGR